MSAGSGWRRRRRAPSGFSVAGCDREVHVVQRAVRAARWRQRLGLFRGDVLNVGTGSEIKVHDQFATNQRHDLRDVCNRFLVIGISRSVGSGSAPAAVSIAWT
jgi:hypothetical protein